MAEKSKESYLLKKFKKRLLKEMYSGQSGYANLACLCLEKDLKELDENIHKEEKVISRKSSGIVPILGVVTATTLFAVHVAHLDEQGIMLTTLISAMCAESLVKLGYEIKLNNDVMKQIKTFKGKMSEKIEAIKASGWDKEDLKAIATVADKHASIPYKRKERLEIDLEKLKDDYHSLKTNNLWIMELEAACKFAQEQGRLPADKTELTAWMDIEAKVSQGFSDAYKIELKAKEDKEALVSQYTGTPSAP